MHFCIPGDRLGQSNLICAWDGLRPLEDEGVEGVSHAALLGREVQARGLARAKAALGREAGRVLGMIREQRGWIREGKWWEKIQEERGPNHGDQ